MDKANQHITKLFIITSSIIFVTLLLIWVLQKLPDVKVPELYGWNSPIILVSSLLVILGHYYIKKDSIKEATISIGFALILGIVFGVIQISGWSEFMSDNQLFRNILFPFSLIHFGHVMIGLALMGLVFYQLTQFKIHSRGGRYAVNIFTFWHFVGAVWIVVMFVL